MEILKWPGYHGKGGVKRTRVYEPTVVVIHICMEIRQGNCLYSYLYIKLVRMFCFSSFFIFSSAKSDNRTAVQVLQGDDVSTGGRERWQRKR
jgi:hypothetical protein